MRGAHKAMMEPEDVRRFERDINAIGRKVNDPEAFAQAVHLYGQLEGVLKGAADRLRTVDGFSWTDIGRALGITRQGAQQRWSFPPSAGITDHTSETAHG